MPESDRHSDRDSAAAAVRLVAFDLDGTILDERGRPAPGTMDTVRALLGHGIHAVSISGRSIRRSLMGLANDLDVAGAIHVCGYNGAAAIAPERDGARELLFATRLTREVFGELTEYAQEQDLNLACCCCEDSANGLVEEYRFRRHTGGALNAVDWQRAGYVLDPQLVDRIRQGSLGPPPKAMIFAPPGGQEEVLAELRRRFEGRIYTAWAIPGLLEIMAPQVNKGVALELLAQRLGVPLDQTLAIGDGNNDLPMLQRAGTGLLMGNAADSVKDAAHRAGIRAVGAFSDSGFALAVREHVRI
jgi:Cof subfamily protein (haloacid dehalogenase superfamily)